MTNEPYCRFHAYSRGWAHGAGGRPQDPDFVNSQEPVLKEEYQNGYKQGHDARTAMHAETARRCGYQPTVLRGIDLPSAPP